MVRKRKKMKTKEVFGTFTFTVTVTDYGNVPTIAHQFGLRGSHFSACSRSHRLFCYECGRHDDESCVQLFVIAIFSCANFFKRTALRKCGTIAKIMNGWRFICAAVLTMNDRCQLRVRKRTAE